MKKPKPYQKRSLLKLTALKGFALQQLACVHCGKLIVAGDKICFDSNNVEYIAHQQCEKEKYLESK